jgi:hypothetical protein
MVEIPLSSYLIKKLIMKFFKAWKAENPDKGYYHYVEELELEMMNTPHEGNDLADREEIDILALSQAFKNLSSWILGDLRDNRINH